jgi:hypothetical protein
MAQVEAKRISGRTVMCDIEYVQGGYAWMVHLGDSEGNFEDQFVCKRKLGAWVEVSLPDLFRVLNNHDAVLVAAVTRESA